MISMVLQADVAEANFAKLSILDRAERFTHYQVRTILRSVMSTKMYRYVRQSVQQIMFATLSMRIFGGCQSAGAIRRARRRGEVPAVAHRHWNEKKRVTGGAPAVAHRHWSEKGKKRTRDAEIGTGNWDAEIASDRLLRQRGRFARVAQLRGKRQRGRASDRLLRQRGSFARVARLRRGKRQRGRASDRLLRRVEPKRGHAGRN